MACKNVHVMHFKKKKVLHSQHKKKSTPPPTEKKNLGSKPGPLPSNQMGRP